jgi:type III pantothenate kinase
VTLLLVDIGNTRVKWARLADGRMGRQHAAANSGWGIKDYARRVLGKRWRVPAVDPRRARGGHLSETPEGDRVIVSSVAGSEVASRFVAAARRVGAPPPEFVTSQRSAAGVTTAYLEPWRLGVDRFVGAIGARHLASGQPVCVVNIGTAMTIDLVDGKGRHVGGAIVPGPQMMVSSLLTQTQGILRRARGGRGDRGNLFARTTRSAIGHGALYGAAATIDRSVEEARRQLGLKPLVLLTGGGSAAVKPLVENGCVSVPDLVLHGLAVWARHQRSRVGSPRRAASTAS